VVSEPTEVLAGALVAALTDLTTVAKGRTVDTGSYSYAYADLDDLVSLTRPVLAAQGLVALTPVHAGDGGGLAVTVTLYHVSGEVLRFDPLPFPAGTDARTSGSSMTYFRRYALLAALGMAAGDPAPADPGDDDAAAHAADPLPAIRKRLGRRVHGLDEQRRAALREWLTAQGLPDRPAKMTEEQCAQVDLHLRVEDVAAKAPAGEGT